MFDTYDFDITFEEPDDDVSMYDDALAEVAMRQDWLDDELEMGYDITVDGGDLSDMLADGVAEVQIVGGSYDSQDAMGNYFIDHGGTRLPLETKEVASFDIDAAISSGTFSSMPGMPDVYKMVDGSDEMYAASIGPDAVSLSGPGLDEVSMAGPGEHQYRVRLLDDTGSVLDQSDWQAYDVDDASVYDELNEVVPGQTKGVAEATKDVGRKYLDRLDNLF